MAGSQVTQRREPTLDDSVNPASPPDSTGVDAPEAPGLGEQFGATRESVKRFVGAHVALAKAELADIADAAKRAAAFVGIAIGAAIVAALIIAVGLPLFVGEALFGSIGWGILLGVFLLAGIALAAVVAALRPGVQAPIGRALLVGVVVGVVVGIVLGLDLTNRGWSALADVIVPTMDPAYRPLVVAIVGLAIIFAVLGLIAGALTSGGGGAIGGVIGGAVAGALLGLLTAFAPGRRVGAAIGVEAGLITWIAAMAIGVVRGGFDTDALKDRFWPATTIETTKETIEWARERMPLSRKS
jgi:hypothetical protein